MRTRTAIGFRARYTGPMRWYAERPDRLARQVVADVVAVLWVVLALVAGVAVHDGLRALEGPGESLVAAGGRVSDAFAGVSGAVSAVPFVGPDLARAFEPASGAGADLASAGRQYGETVGTLAAGSLVVVPLVLLLPVLLGWLPLRLRYARRAGAAVAARDTAPDLLAVRALTRVPVARLTRIAPDPAAAWRAGDPDVVRRLAGLELEALGLRLVSG
ncbi:putative CONSERVED TRANSMEMBRANE PROTEIN [Pseudonocardia sp. Ae707_Ps1]|nr:putative CONSERVED TRANSMEMBRANE PROTEIN [Pseudonocardia sp. Ae707_Ps1]